MPGEAPEKEKDGEPSAARGASLALVVALAATLTMTAPVVMAPRQRVFGSAQTFAPGDPNRDPLVVIEQFRTGSVAPPYLQPLTDLPGRALARAIGPVAAYNVVVLATFPLAAATAYLLARYVLGSHLAAMVAGLAYAFLPFHVAQAAHHAHVAQTQWLPLYLLGLWRSLDRPGVRPAAFLLAAAGATALSNFYGGFIAAVTTPVALVGWGVVSPRRPGEGRWRRLAPTVLTLGVAAAVGALFVHHATGRLGALPEEYAFPRSDLFLHSARWWSYLVPPVDHPLTGAWARALWAGSDGQVALLEQQVSLGWALLVLAALPLVRWARGDRTTLAFRSAPVLAAVALAAVACSLSPERTVGTFTFVRPSAFLYEAAPVFRAYARFGVVVGLMTALLAGAGTTWLWRRQAYASRAAAVLLVVLAALEGAPFPPWRFRDVLPTPAHRWLAAQPGPLRVLDCATGSRVSDALAVPLLGHSVSLLGASGFDDCGEPQLGDKLKAMGYTHAVVRGESAIAPSVGAGEGRIVVAATEKPRVYVRGLRGFFPREDDGATTWRWMGQAGALRLVATEPSVGAVLELELRSFPGDRLVRWAVDGQSRGQVEATGEWRWHALPLGPLAPRETTLSLTCAGPAIVANGVLNNGDPRALGLALGRWKVSIPPSP